MKVLHINTEKGWRGGEQQLAYLIYGLARSGVSNIVFARKGSELEEWCRQNNVIVFSQPTSQLKILTALFLKKVAIQSAPDLIHIHAPNAHTIATLSVLFGNHVPCVLSRRVDFLPKNNWFTRLKYNHQNIRRIICVSDRIRDIMQRYVANPHRVLTVHSGIDLRRFEGHDRKKLKQDFNLSENSIVIGNTSALESHKDYYTFILTIKALIQQGLNIHSFIIGGGSLDKKLKQFAQENALSEAITFTGFRLDVNKLLPCFDFFLTTPTEEGLGTSILDAFAAKVPVVATAAGGIPEMVEHLKTGWLSPIGDVQHLASGVLALISDPELKDRIIANASARVQDFSKEVTADKTLTVYRQVIG